MGLTINDMIPIAQFGRDHWTTLAYLETVMVECGGFQVGFDGRMRQGRRNFRVMDEEYPNPKRPCKCRMGIVMDLEHSTILTDGTKVDGHDDWHCVQDMIANGILSGDCQPGEVLSLTDIGKSLVGQLRDHKRNGGAYGDFRPSIELSHTSTAPEVSE